MPLCIPASPDFTTGSERLVWERLRDGLGPGDLLVANLRVTDEAKDHELDLLVGCLLYTSPSPRDGLLSRMPSSA